MVRRGLFVLLALALIGGVIAQWCGVPVAQLAYGSLVRPMRWLQYQLSMTKPLADELRVQLQIGNLPNPVAQRIGLWAVLKEARSAGLTPREQAVTFAVVRRESGFEPWAKNPKSSACGLFQMIAATGELHQLAWWECMDPMSNARAGMRLVSKYIKRLGASLGTEAGIRCFYLLHYYGTGHDCQGDPAGIWPKVGPGILSDTKRLEPLLKDHPSGFWLILIRLLWLLPPLALALWWRRRRRSNSRLPSKGR